MAALLQSRLGGSMTEVPRARLAHALQLTSLLPVALSTVAAVTVAVFVGRDGRV